MKKIKHTQVPKGWEIVKDVPKTVTGVIEVVSFLKEGEDYIDGKTLQTRAKELNAALGLADAEWLLEHQETIPKEAREFYLVFTGTIFRDPIGNLVVAYLCWNGDRWVLRFGWIGRGWVGGSLLPRSKSLALGSSAPSVAEESVLGRLDSLEKRVEKLEKRFLPL